ncbi:hypothetical protein [Methanocella conradii]|nr:hypothetical protein [Methanocella conradii]
MALDGEQLSWTCLRFERTVCRIHCEQCERAIIRMVDFQCR